MIDKIKNTLAVAKRKFEELRVYVEANTVKVVTGLVIVVAVLALSHLL